MDAALIDAKIPLTHKPCEFGGDPLTIVWDATKMQAQKEQQEEYFWWRTSLSLTVLQHIT
jgi:hypothetical protein